MQEQKYLLSKTFKRKISKKIEQNQLNFHWLSFNKKYCKRTDFLFWVVPIIKDFLVYKKVFNAIDLCFYGKINKKQIADK